MANRSSTQEGMENTQPSQGYRLDDNLYQAYQNIANKSNSSTQNLNRSRPQSESLIGKFFDFMKSCLSYIMSWIKAFINLIRVGIGVIIGGVIFVLAHILNFIVPEDKT